MSELPWSKFFWSDWEADQGLRLCSLSAQGLWMRMLCVCAKGDPKGYFAINGKPLDSTGAARLCGITAEQAATHMEELELNGVFSRDRRGWIYNRRMVKDAKRSATGKKFANKRWSQADVTKQEKSQPNGLPSGGPTTHIPEARGQNKRKTKKRNLPIAEDAVISSKQIEIAKAEGYGEAEARAQFERFKDSNLSKGRTYANWDAAWRNWFRSPYFKQILTAANDGDDFLDSVIQRQAGGQR